MDIGQEKPAIIVEPVEDPFRAAPKPAPMPSEAPDREAAPVEAGGGPVGS